MVKRRAAKRPSAPQGSKEESLRIRISTAEKEALAAAATRDGLSLSAWLRQTTLRAAGYLPRTP
jgi:predicted HicB family RNase H-like nuclease